MHLQNLRKAHDMIERRAEFMRHAIQKIAFGKVGDFGQFFGVRKLGSSFAHALFQFFARMPQFLFDVSALLNFLMQLFMLAHRLLIKPAAQCLKHVGNDQQKRIRRSKPYFHWKRIEIRRDGKDRNLQEHQRNADIRKQQRKQRLPQT